MWIAVTVYFALLGTFYSVSVFLERSAAMRGSNRKALPTWVDKTLRLFFLFILVSPAGFFAPWVVTPLVLLYLPTFVDNGEKTGKRVSPALKRFPIWQLFKWYFRLSVLAPYGKLNPKKQYVIGAHPHGFLPFGTMVNLLSTVTDVEKTVLNGVQIRTLAASFCFYIPIYRDLILGGGVIDAARYNAKRALENGYSIALVPGGATEALYAGMSKLVLKKRTGFIKLAIESGADLVPVYSFGENETYHQLASVFPLVSKVQAKFQRIFGLSLPVVTSIIPRRSTITTVFGKPIPVKKIAEPTDAEVQAVLTVYIDAITALFDAHSEQYIADPAKRKMEII